MITAQSRAIDADPEAPMLPLAMDAAVVRFRKLVAETIAAERGDRAAPMTLSRRGTSATRARSPDWRASRSRPSARAASATGPRSRSACSRRSRRWPDGRRGSPRSAGSGSGVASAALSWSHQRPVLVGADGDAGSLRRARAGATGRSRVSRRVWRDSRSGAVMAVSARGPAPAGRYPRSEAARPGFNPAPASLRRAP